MIFVCFLCVVLFDLDGMLLDSVLDFVVICNVMLVEWGWVVIDLVQLWLVVFKGLCVMVGVVFLDLDVVVCDVLILEFLQCYEVLIGQYVVLFDGVVGMFVVLDEVGMVWGIVINKLEYLVCLILLQYGWQQCCVVLVGGDSLVECKLYLLLLLYVV